MRFVLNNTVLSNFAAVSQLKLLKEAIGNLFTTIEVYEEILEGIMKGYQFLEEIEKAISYEGKEGWIGLLSLANQKEHSLMVEMLPRVKQGEASCIAIALCRKMVFVSDDWKAREIAKEKGVLFSGTIGILKICLDDGIISLAEGNRILNAMIDNGYYSPIRELNEL